MQPILRPASRVLLLDPDGRVLLFRVDVREKPLWITPGGGVERGETHEEAAHRELWEETGIDAEPGPCVWVRRQVFEFQGRMFDEKERFYVVRLDAATEVTRANWMAHEHTFMQEHRWWTADENCRLGRLVRAAAARRAAAGDRSRRVSGGAVRLRRVN